MIRFFLNSNNEFLREHGNSLMSAGVIFLLIGLLIVLVPEILVAFIASIFFVIGGFLLYLGWKIRKELKQSSTYINIDWE